LLLLAVNAGQAGFMLAQGIVTLRAMGGTTAALQAATWDRLLRLTVGFFRRFDTGDLLNRAMLITEVSQALRGSSLRSLLTGLMTLFNLGLLFYYSAFLALLAVLLSLVCVAVTALFSLAVSRRAVEQAQWQGRLFGFVVQIVNGIAKLRVAGAERRA